MSLFNEAASKTTISVEATKAFEVSEATDSPMGETTTWDASDLSWKKDTSPVTLSVYLDYSWWPLDNWGKDEITQEIKMTDTYFQFNKLQFLNYYIITVGGWTFNVYGRT